jgi:hypothetical protein
VLVISGFAQPNRSPRLTLLDEDRPRVGEPIELLPAASKHPESPGFRSLGNLSFHCRLILEGAKLGLESPHARSASFRCCRRERPRTGSSATHLAGQGYPIDEFHSSTPGCGRRPAINLTRNRVTLRFSTGRRPSGPPTLPGCPGHYRQCRVRGAV